MLLVAVRAGCDSGGGNNTPPNAAAVIEHIEDNRYEIDTKSTDQDNDNLTHKLDTNNDGTYDLTKQGNFIDEFTSDAQQIVLEVSDEYSLKVECTPGMRHPLRCRG